MSPVASPVVWQLRRWGPFQQARVFSTASFPWFHETRQGDEAHCSTPRTPPLTHLHVQGLSLQRKLRATTASFKPLCLLARLIEKALVVARSEWLLHSLHGRHSISQVGEICRAGAKMECADEACWLSVALCHEPARYLQRCNATARISLTVEHWCLHEEKDKA